MPGESAAPTAFPDLNELLAGFVARTKPILGANFVGAYLTGSFALGAGELHSDCDFLVVLEHQVAQEQERALREVHKEIPTRPGYWPHNLEGSYAPRGDLASPASLGKDWLYVDRGRVDMQWSSHCNTADVRWTLRERGITLAGPAARDLVAEVPADVLRGRMRPQIASFLPDLLGWISLEIAWAQRYAVASLCRMLYTLETGEVASKPSALEWAKRRLGPARRDLFQQVLDDLPLGWDPHDAPRPGSVEATIAFAGYAKERAAG